MAILFPNNTISEVALNRISYPNNVIQIIDNPFTATLSVNNWATQNEIATATITPSSVNSKILVYVNMHFRGDITQGTWSLGYVWVRNNTANTELMRSGWNGTWRHTISNWSKHYLDSPNSTSPQTYSVRCGNYPSGVHTFNTGNSHDGISHIRLMEIGG